MHREVLDSETESDRLERIEQLVGDSGPGWSEDYKPGSFGCHELLDRTSTLAEHVEHLILSHPSCVLDPEWYALAESAASALRDLYQRIGAVHLGGDVAGTNQAPMTTDR